MGQADDRLPLGPATGVGSLTPQPHLRGTDKNRTVDQHHVRVAFPHHQLLPVRFPCVVKAMMFHYFFTPEIRDHLSIQPPGEEPPSHYLWIILTIAFVR